MKFRSQKSLFTLEASFNMWQPNGLIKINLQLNNLISIEKHMPILSDTIHIDPILLTTKCFCPYKYI